MSDAHGKRNSTRPESCGATTEDEARSILLDRRLRGETVQPSRGERISEAEQAARAAQAPLKPKAEQKPADQGLFGARGQADLVDEARKPAPNALERIPGENGTEVLIVQNSDGKRFNVVMRDTDAQETVGPVSIVPTLERARAKAREMLKPPEGAAKPPVVAPETSPGASDRLSVAPAAAIELPKSMTLDALKSLCARASTASPAEKAKIAKWLEDQYASLEKEGARIAQACLEQGGGYSIR